MPGTSKSRRTVSKGPVREKRALIYIRVSTKGQAVRDGNAEGYSLPTQREACRHKAEALGAVVVDEYIDKDTATSVDKRPALQRMVEYVVTHRDIDYVIFHQLSRFARYVPDDARITLELEMAGASLVSCVESIDETATGRLMHWVLAGLNEYQSRNMGNDIKVKTLQKVKDGGTPSLAPIGYLNRQDLTGGGKGKRWVELDPERAPHITWAFETYATGNYSLSGLLDELTARGLTTRATARRPSQPLHPSLVQRILTNPYYMGIVTYNGVEYQGKHEALVTPDVFNQVQEVLAQHNTSGERHWRHEHYLKGTVYCGVCGGRLSLTHAKGNGGVYAYYFCLGRRRNGDSCWQKAIQVGALEQVVEDFWHGVRMRPQRADELEAVVREDLTGARKQAAHEKDIQERRIQTLTAERKKLLDAYYGGAVPMDLLRSEQGRIASEMQGANKRIAETRRLFDDIELTVRRAIDWATNLSGAYASADRKLRRQLNQAVFRRLLVWEDGVAAYEYTDGMELLFETLTTVRPIPPQRIRSSKNSDHGTAAARVLSLVPQHGHGLNVHHLVEVAGVEPASPELSVGLLRAQPLQGVTRRQVNGNPTAGQPRLVSRPAPGPYRSVSHPG